MNNVVSAFSRLSELPVHTFKTNLCYKLFYPTTNYIKVDIKRAKDSKILTIVLCLLHSWNFPLESVGNGFLELLFCAYFTIRSYGCNVIVLIFHWKRSIHQSKHTVSSINLQIEKLARRHTNNVWLSWEFYRPCTLRDYIFLLFPLGERRKRTSERRYPIISPSRKRRKSLFRRVSPIALGICFPALDSLLMLVFNYCHAHHSSFPVYSP